MKKISNNNNNNNNNIIIVTCKTNNVQDLHESQFLKCENKDIELEKKKSEANRTEPNINIETKSQSIDEIVKNNGNTVLKNDVTEDGVSIKTVLSKDEASSGFETISSADSKVNINDQDFSSFFNEDDYNIIVNVKNDLAFQYKNSQPRRISYCETRNRSSNWKNYKADDFSNEYTNQKHNGFRSLKEPKFRQRNNVDKNYNYGRRDRESSERKNFDHSSQRICSDDWSTYRDQVRRSKRSRQDDLENRSMQSRSNERTGRFRGSRSSERILRNRSPNYKDLKTESRRSRSFERYFTKSSPERSSPPRKKCNSFSEDSFSSVWRRLGNLKSRSKIKRNEISNDKINVRNCFDNAHKKKERTPFLVELEKKLKELERSRSIQQKLNGPLAQTSGNELAVIPRRSPALCRSYNPSLSLTCMTSVPYAQGAVYSVPYIPVPAVSVNNLPLVPGPTGLPVHIMPTGEQIPHDMDGRPIPVGPNGFYLPVDPTGRIFAHIISPGNQAVPIHMTEDGVLRLPNSEPVPFGPDHQLPVNVDGRVIPIGPDSKPLYPCPDLPKEPPLNLLQMVDSNGGGHKTKTVPPLAPPQMGDPKAAQTETKETRFKNQASVQPPEVDLSSKNLVRNPSEEINEIELLNKYKKKGQKKSEDVLKCTDIEKNLDINLFKGGVKRSIPIKLSQKKTFRDDSGNSGTDIVLDSGDSDSVSPAKPVIESNKGPVEEILSNSDDDVLEIICDKEVPNKLNLETKFEDYITEKVQRAIKLLCKKNHTPPTVGRFIVSDDNLVPSTYNLPNESPLLKNRIQLSFLAPSISLNDQVITIKESEVHFTFLSQKKSFQKGEQRPSVKEKNPNSTTIPVFTFDFAVQCDFTSEIIKKLNFKISKLEMEVARLKRLNRNLFDDFNYVQTAKQKKAEELRKALLEIQEKSNEIRSLKRSMKTPE